MPMRDFEIDLLRTFVVIVETGGFTRAAERLGRTQSTISLQIKRLEDALGKRLFDRQGRGIRLSSEGELLLGYARQILRLNDEARTRLMEPEIEGTVRLGTPEDFATTHLPGVLKRFAEAHPRVALEVECDFTVNLKRSFDQGEFDIILIKQDPQAGESGVMVWREPLCWVAANAHDFDDEPVLPLVLAPQPDVYRKRALDALQKVMRPWRITYTSPSLAGTQAAVRAGLGITVLPKEMVPTGLRTLGGDHGLPKLDDAEVALCHRPALSRAAEMLSQHIIHSLEMASSDRPAQQPIAAPSERRSTTQAA